MFTGMEMMACNNLAVSAEVMQHIVNVESGANPYAIGVVGGQLMRQPQNLGEALATVNMLDAKGYNYSLGVAQVNRVNLGKYGLDSYEKAFEVCPNLEAGAKILASCYASSGGDWGKSFSCYYSGNFVTGYRDGYVQKVYDSINRSAQIADSNQAQAIPLKASAAASHGSSKPNKPSMTIVPSDSAAYRLALRSVILDTAVAAAVPAIATVPAGGPMDTAQTSLDPLAVSTASANPAITAAPSPGVTGAGALAAAGAGTAATFVPQVRGPNDPSSESSPALVAPQAEVASTAIQAPAGDNADLRRESRDAAFVY